MLERERTGRFMQGFSAGLEAGWVELQGCAVRWFEHTTLRTDLSHVQICIWSPSYVHICV